jgi:methionyl-tRNA synthetase
MYKCCQMTDSRYYITTPIYYPNGEPHLGHVYTTLCADVLARYHRQSGAHTWFLTGTDEHGVKMVKTAADQKVEPQQLADRNVAVFEALWTELKVSHDDFIRTSSARHKAGVTAIVERMLATGDIYLGAYEGWYDEGQEEFVTENNAKEQEYKSAVSGRPLVRYKEPTYFFRLAKYVPQVIDAIESDALLVRPESRKNEVLSKLRQGVEDLSISRASLTWGIPLPNDPKHVLYVWIDALSNYVTALGYPDADRYKQFWPADCHLIGKEILWFHAVYWPAMLISLGQPLPRLVFAHGWWTSEGKKMSKSLGNFVDIDKLRGAINTYSLDALRYYLLRAAPFGSDLDYKDSELATSYAELGNVVGNLLNRTLNMIGKYREGKIPARPAKLDELGQSLLDKINAIGADLASAYANVELQRVATLPVDLARAANTYIDQTAPFKLAKDPNASEQLDGVLNLIAQACRAILASLLPVMPEKASAGLAQLNVDAAKPLPSLLSTELAAGHQLGTAAVLFPRIETAK